MRMRLGMIAAALVALAAPSNAPAQGMTLYDGELVGHVKTISESFDASDGHRYDVTLVRTGRGTIQIAVNCDGAPSVRSEISEQELEVKKPTSAPLGLNLWLGQPIRQCSRDYTLQIYFIGNIASEASAASMVEVDFSDGRLDMIRPRSLE